MPRIIVVSLAFLMYASPVLAKRSKCDVTLQRIDTLLEVYEKEHPLKHYPSTLEELQNFATKKNSLSILVCFQSFRTSGAILLSLCPTPAKIRGGVPRKSDHTSLSIEA